MIFSTNPRYANISSRIGNLILIGALGLTLTLAVAVGVRTIGSGSNSSETALATKSAAATTAGSQPVLYIVESAEQAHEINRWHVAEQSSSGSSVPYEVLFAPAEGALADGLLRDIQMLNAASGRSATVVDLSRGPETALATKSAAATTVGSQSVVYIVASADQAHEINRWHVAEQSSSGSSVPYEVLFAPAEGALADGLLRDIQMLNAASGRSVNVVDLSVR